MRKLVWAAGALLLLGAAPASLPDDLRGLRVGAMAADLPAEGFADFHCQSAPDATLTGWRDWAKCPAGAQGRHEIQFGYELGETMVAGHPVALTAGFGADGRLDELRIETDPKARLFLRKKAFLLGLQARSRYGDEGWTCTDGAPDANAEPVGGVFIAQVCRKTLPGKSLVIERNLLRRPGTDLKAFVGETRITVSAVP